MSESHKKLVFLFVPIDGIGHVNPFIGIAEPLRDRGHQVIFATPNNWKTKFEAMGFQEECYLTLDPVQDENAPPFSDQWGKLVSQLAPALASTSEEQLKDLVVPFFREGIKQFKYIKQKLKTIVEKTKPDLIMVDSGLHTCALDNPGIPWILLYSMNPIAISSTNVPPGYSGYPTDSDPILWEKFVNTYWEHMRPLYEEHRDWTLESSGRELKPHYQFLVQYSPFANIYMCPEELDYTMFRPNPPNWHRFDSLLRSTREDETFEIPGMLQQALPGKLIYFSMGTIGCSELGLMRRLISILAKSLNRFIVSKGPLADKYDLAANMWGAPSVPQTKVIQLVDLVITHGGNNTITECFYFGKRVLVLPLFCDQLDNGQRIFETGFGLRFHPYHVTEEELLGAIETLLNDDLLERRMITISKRIQSSNNQSRAADLVENTAMKYMNK